MTETMGDKDLISLKQNIDDFAKSHLRGKTTQQLLDAGVKEVGYRNTKGDYCSALVNTLIPHYSKQLQKLLTGATASEIQFRFLGGY